MTRVDIPPPPPTSPILIAGAGIGGLAATLACSRAQPHRTIQVWERAPELTEVGAGIQLGPNATRILQRWGLEPALRKVANALHLFAAPR